MAVGSKRSWVYAKEATYGSLAGASTPQTMRFSRDTYKPEFAQIESDEILGTVDIADSVRTFDASRGDFVYRMAPGKSVAAGTAIGLYGCPDDQLLATIGATSFTALASAGPLTTITPSGPTGSVQGRFTAGSAAFSSFAAGNFVRVAGFTGALAANNRLWYVVAKDAGNTWLDVLGSVDVVAGSPGDSVTITEGDRARNAGNTTSFYCGRQGSDVASYVDLFPGLIFRGMSIDYQVGQMLTATFRTRASTLALATSLPAGLTSAAAAGTTSVMNASTGLHAVAENGVSVILQTLQLTHERKTDDQTGLGKSGLIGQQQHKHRISGTLTAYFAGNSTLGANTITRLLANSVSTLAVAMADASTPTKGYGIYLPSIKYTDGDWSTTGDEEILLLRLSFTGIYSSALGGTMQIQRFI